jgi:hypothetical protein
MPPKQPNTFFRYSNLAIQMGLIIGLAVWGGQKLDARFTHGDIPVYTIILSLAGIGIALYLAIKDLLRQK